MTTSQITVTVKLFFMYGPEFGMFNSLAFLGIDKSYTYNLRERKSRSEGLFTKTTTYTTCLRGASKDCADGYSDSNTWKQEKKEWCCHWAKLVGMETALVQQ